MTRVLTLITVALFAFAASVADAQDTERYGKQKVVYHINYDGGDDDRAYRGAMRNIQNHINAVGAENLDVKVVLHGNGLGLLMGAASDDGLQYQVASLKSQNVDFQVCNNTLEGREINYEDDLYDVWEEDIVPSGVAELARLQAMGYTYIKPRSRLEDGSPARYFEAVLQGTMDINAHAISGSDPGAVPGGSTRHPLLGEDGAETGSTNV